MSTEPKSCATAEDFFACYRQVPRRRHVLPGGKHVWLHGMTEYEWQHWLGQCARDEEGLVSDPYGDAKLLAETIRDDQGQRLFDTAGVMKLAACGAKGLRPLKRIAMELNGADGQTEKNSEATPGSDSA